MSPFFRLTVFGQMFFTCLRKLNCIFKLRKDHRVTERATVGLRICKPFRRVNHLLLDRQSHQPVSTSHPSGVPRAQTATLPTATMQLTATIITTVVASARRLTTRVFWRLRQRVNRNRWAKSIINNVCVLLLIFTTRLWCTLIYLIQINLAFVTNFDLFVFRT